MYSGPFPDIGAREYSTESRIKNRVYAPKRHVLAQNYPNPFNGNTTIPYDIFTTTPVSMRIHDLRGQHVSTLLNDIQSPGHYEITWRALDRFGYPLPSGIYICTIQAGHEKNYIKLVLLE
jgi:hypothetical protein